jgi:hypothetical protein
MAIETKAAYGQFVPPETAASHMSGPGPVRTEAAQRSARLENWRRITGKSMCSRGKGCLIVAEPVR